MFGFIVTVTLLLVAYHLVRFVEFVSGESTTICRVCCTAHLVSEDCPVCSYHFKKS